MALGFLYLLRGAGDIGNETLSYISPLGLAQRTQAFVENNWFPIPILLTEAAAVTAGAFALNGHRDVRQGYFPNGADGITQERCSAHPLVWHSAC